MNKTTKHIHHSRFALLFLALFISTLLIKPAHSLLVHHEHSVNICTTNNEQALTTDHFNNCPVCDFEFCIFIPQKQITISQAIIIISNEKSLPTVACPATISTHLFQLRAPPAL